MLCNKISEWWHATDNLIAQYAHWAYTPLVGWTASEFHSGVSPVTMWSPAKSLRKDSVESSNLKRCQFKRRSSASKIFIQNEWAWSYQVSLISVICDNVAVMRLKARQNNCTDKWVCEFIRKEVSRFQVTTTWSGLRSFLELCDETSSYTTRQTPNIKFSPDEGSTNSPNFRRIFGEDL